MICKTFLGVVVAAAAAAVVALLNPPVHIHLDRQSLEYDLREGRTYSHFLADAEWTVMSSAGAPVVDSIEEVEFSLAGPVFHRLSEEGLRKQCPPETLTADGGGPAFLRHVFAQTDRVAVFGPSRHGDNAIGCTNLTYVPSAELLAQDDIDPTKYALHFDGNLHRSMETADPDYVTKRVHTVSTFFSNLTEARLTAPMHSAMVINAAVVCSGTKTWFFAEPDASNDFGHHMYSGGTLGKGFAPDTKFFAMQTQPGDILSFGTYWHHIVVTDPGVGFMQTYRVTNRDVLANGIRQFGMSYLSSMVDVRRTSVGWTNSKKDAPANQAQDHPLRISCRNDMDEDAWGRLVGRIDQEVKGFSNSE